MSSPSEADDATRGSAIKLAAEAGGRVLGLATTLVLARGLGVSDFGVFAATSGAAVLVAELANMGLQATAARGLVAGTMGLRPLVRAKAALTAAVLAIVAALALSDRGAGFLALFVPLTIY